MVKGKKFRTNILPWIINILFTIIVPTVSMVTMECIHRTALDENFFTEHFFKYYPSYILAWLMLLFLYVFVLGVTGLHQAATGVTGITANLFGTVCYYKLVMRSEPFLPWDLSQIGDLAGVADKVEFTVPDTAMWAGMLFLILFIASFFVRFPRVKHRPLPRIIMAAVSFAGTCVILFGIYLVPANSQWFGIYPDSWMQDRYYRNYGVITGFMTNLTLLEIKEPDGYSAEAVQEIADATEKAARRQQPLYENSYATKENEEAVTTPNIIYLMNESFWDVTRLGEGIVYDRDITPNLTALKQEAAYGLEYSPSFGGGTCDVEFEALTGFNIEYLPSGAKPYQQYVTKSMFSLPRYLLSLGYNTTAVHGYYERFWSRNTAYPNLGIMDFISREDMFAPDLKRGFVSDHEMTQQIIKQYEKYKDDGPVFIHAVTMQNHTTYGANRYSADDYVNIVENNVGLTSKTITQLRDFATGIYEADAALGELVEYLRTVEEPTMLVFWGDHFNPIGKDYELYEKTGFIEKGDTTSPALRGTDLLIWSNYDSSSIELGTIAAYEITPVMMDLYGLEKPPYFEFLTQEMSVMRARSHGVTVETDGTYSDTMTEKQQTWFDNQWLWQYDMMFGDDIFGANALAENITNPD